mmetsp:Transcript_8211/g.20389  ORF Transcript_8211/g.20389 Transcript_8211/m.20389 type:complete len:211 (+) Transcript_8211:90-722(+)
MSISSRKLLTSTMSQLLPNFLKASNISAGEMVPSSLLSNIFHILSAIPTVSSVCLQLRLCRMTVANSSKSTSPDPSASIRLNSLSSSSADFGWPMHDIKSESSSRSMVPLPLTSYVLKSVSSSESMYMVCLSVLIALKFLATSRAFTACVQDWISSPTSGAMSSAFSRKNWIEVSTLKAFFCFSSFMLLITSWMWRFCFIVSIAVTRLKI